MDTFPFVPRKTYITISHRGKVLNFSCIQKLRFISWYSKSSKDGKGERERIFIGRKNKINWIWTELQRVFSYVSCPIDRVAWINSCLLSQNIFQLLLFLYEYQIVP